MWWRKDIKPNPFLKPRFGLISDYANLVFNQIHNGRKLGWGSMLSALAELHFLEKNELEFYCGIPIPTSINGTPAHLAEFQKPKLDDLERIMMLWVLENKLDTSAIDLDSLLKFQNLFLEASNHRFIIDDISHVMLDGNVYFYDWTQHYASNDKVIYGLVKSKDDWKKLLHENGHYCGQLLPDNTIGFADPVEEMDYRLEHL